MKAYMRYRMALAFFAGFFICWGLAKMPWGPRITEDWTACLGYLAIGLVLTVVPAIAAHRHPFKRQFYLETKVFTRLVEMEGTKVQIEQMVELNDDPHVMRPAWIELQSGVDELTIQATVEAID